MKTRWLLLALIGFLLPALLQAQDNDKGYVYGTFRGTRVVNGHSVHTLHGGEMEFLISHRFGALSGGPYEFFGLDQSSIRLGLEYGLRDWINIGLGRSSYGKEFDSFVKLRLLRQSKASPVSVTTFSSVAYNTLRPIDPGLPVPTQSRLAYANQVLIARKWNDYFSLQLMPTHLHYNLVETGQDRNDVFSIGAAAKVQVSKNIALTAEYYYTLPNQLSTTHYDPIALGIDINTGSHVFQIHLTNARGMIEKAFIGQTTENWMDGDIHLGFNISRVFKLKGRRY